ncbi:MAG: LptF/LptG family permease [Chthoniobacterales bacterium]
MKFAVYDVVYDSEPLGGQRTASPKRIPEIENLVRLLDRYVLRMFLEAYFYCIAAFISIWLIFDISDNISTFLDDRISFGMVLSYYVTQVPQILVILLPVSLLLALLFSLGRMSRTNEIVSMLTAGISVPRLILPLIIVGLLTTGLMTVLNWSWAPHAEHFRKTYFEGGRVDARDVAGQIFRNRADNRTWYIQLFRQQRNELVTVQILQQNKNDDIVKSYFATSALYHPETKTWELRSGRIVNYDATGNITGEESFESLMLDNWTETPYRLASANMRAEFLSWPELGEYLRYNSDFPRRLLAPFLTHMQYRLALPWTSFVVVLLAAPLAIGSARGNVLSSVAAAIGLVFAMNFLSHFFLALGEGNRIAPWAAAWTPNLLFAAVGLFLLYLRSSNREARSLNPFAARRVSPA